MIAKEFKVGDRVVVNQDPAEPQYAYADGRHGTVYYVSMSGGLYPYGVRLDRGGLVHLKGNEITRVKEGV